MIEIFQNPRFLKFFMCTRFKKRYQDFVPTTSSSCIYIYIYIYVCVCVCVCVEKLITTIQVEGEIY